MVTLGFKWVGGVGSRSENGAKDGFALQVHHIFVSQHPDAKTVELEDEDELVTLVKM